LIPVTTSSGDFDLRGTLVYASPELKRNPVHLRGTATDLTLDVQGQPSILLKRVGSINQAQLARVAIIGHRGLSLGQPTLMNSIRAINHAWVFGASGVEVDVTVPFVVTNGRRIPTVGDLRMHHPPVFRSEVTGFDSTALNALETAPTLREALNAVVVQELPLTYLDVKLRWLVSAHHDEARAVLAHVALEGHRAAEAFSRLSILVGAETDAAAEALAAGGIPAGPNVGWAQEWTRGTDARRFALRASGDVAATPPRALSFNLLRIRQAPGGWLGLLLPDLSAEWERRFAALPQPFIFWTVETEPQLRASLDAQARMSSRSRRAAVITPFPHRAAFYLATTGVR